ncbi:unnamed protein product, partial [Phaeothamnion confervicola]
KLYPAIGALILNWALIESVLEKWVATIYHCADGKSIDAEIPRMYSPKVKFLRRCFNRLNALESFKPKAIEYLDEADRLAEIKSIVTHGAVSSFDPKSEKIEFTRLDVDRQRSIHTVRSNQLSVTDIMNAGNAGILLCQNVVTLGHSMLSSLSGDQN